LNGYGLPCWKPNLGTSDGGPTTLEECAHFNWWVRDRCLHYLIAVDGIPAGFSFVLADGEPPLPDTVDFELMDFYIAPKYRRQGVGTAAACQLFERHRGRWQVFQLARNTAAISFWHRTIGNYMGGRYESRDKGTEQRFDNRVKRDG
jgi:predicted acetyltransferase